MKKVALLILAIALISGFEARSQSKADSLAIEKACRDYAMARASNTKYGFFDYCQLARFNGEWKIINVLWGWLPRPATK